MKDVRSQIELYVKEANYKEALRLLFRLNTYEIEKCVYFYAIGQCYRFIGDLPNSIHFLEDAKTLNPGCEEVTYALGAVYELSLQYEHAIEAFKEVAAMNPDRIAAYNKIGLLHARSGRMQEALVWYAKALERMGLLHVSHIWVQERTYTALLRAKMGFSFAFPKKLEDALNLEIQNMIIRNNIGVCYYEEGNYTIAKKWFSQSIASIPRGVDYGDPLVYMMMIEKVGSERSVGI